MKYLAPNQISCAARIFLNLFGFGLEEKEDIEENTTEEYIDNSNEEEIIEEEIIEEYYEGILNDDLTYTVNGITYESKEVYEYFLLYPDQFYMDPDGIVRPISNIESNEYQKTLK